MAKRNVQLVQDSVNRLETNNGINVAQVTGAAVDNQLVRFNGTTGELQGSGVVIADNGNISGGSLTSTTSGLTSYFGILDVNSTQINSYSGTTGKDIIFRQYLTERMRIDSAGNVGIGTSNPTKRLEVANSYTFGAPSTNGVAKMGSLYIDSSQYPNISFAASYSGSGLWTPEYAHSSSITLAQSNITFSTNAGLTAGANFTPTERMRINSIGNVGIGVVPSGVAKLQVAGGLKLGNTVNTDATTLDWYEEGTTTLTATGLTTAPTGTGRFTRNGDTVTALIPIISGTSNTTTFTLTGIPTNFRPSADRNVLVRTQDNGGAIIVSNAIINSSGVLTMYKDAGATEFTASGTKSVQSIQIQYHI